jgi:hypothetical protein
MKEICLNMKTSVKIKYKVSAMSDKEGTWLHERKAPTTMRRCLSW